MRLLIEPGFVHKTREPRYFVRWLDAADSGWTCGFRWEIQMLNEEEAGAAVVEFGPDDGVTFLRFLNVDLPQAVVEAVMAGLNGEYVDRDGRRRQPGFLGGGLIES